MAVAPRAYATGLQEIGTSSLVSVDEITYDIQVDGQYVSGVMEVQFSAESGSTNSANLRFPLPPGAVIHRAEVYLPGQERWETAETLGRREGEFIHNDIVEEQPEVDPLLVQRLWSRLSGSSNKVITTGLLPSIVT